MKLTVRTEPLEDDRPLLDLSPVSDPVAWIRDGQGLIGWGTALRIEPGPGEHRFVRADQALRDLAHDSDVEDAVDLPGTGLIGVGSFTFDADVAGSALIVPRVVVGRRNGVTWRTTIDPDGAEPVAGVRAAPPTDPPRDRPGTRGPPSPMSTGSKLLPPRSSASMPAMPRRSCSHATSRCGRTNCSTRSTWPGG